MKRGETLSAKMANQKPCDKFQVLQSKFKQIKDLKFISMIEISKPTSEIMILHRVLIAYKIGDLKLELHRIEIEFIPGIENDWRK